MHTKLITGVDSRFKLQASSFKFKADVECSRAHHLKNVLHAPLMERQPECEVSDLVHDSALKGSFRFRLCSPVKMLSNASRKGSTPTKGSWVERGQDHVTGIGAEHRLSQTAVTFFCLCHAALCPHGEKK